MSNLVESSGISNKYTSTGRHSGYQVDLYHSGLDEHKHLSAVEQSALQGKIHNQKSVWSTKWDKELAKQAQQSKEEDAKARTEKAHKKLKQVETTLEHTLSIDDAIDWDSMKYNDEFSWNITEYGKTDFIKFNKKTGYPEKFTFIETKPAPIESSFFTQPTFFQKLLRQEDKIRAKQQQEFDTAVDVTKAQNEDIRKDNIEREASFEAIRNKWQQDKEEFEDIQRKINDEVDKMKVAYENKERDGIVAYCAMVLDNSEYHDLFLKQFIVEYNEANRMLLVEYQLPSIDKIPSINNVKYIKSRDEIEEKVLSQSAHAKLYDVAIYQIVLRTLHELFEADVVDAIEAINLNGIVTAINPATGHEETSCILSIQAKKEEFEAINLEGIVASQSFKECFKSLKGVGSTKLSTMTPVKPLLQINKSDKRFRDHYEVADGLNDEVNIASMGWEDFEHLVRELFAKEFTENGGEVRVTQASADGGVDAIAFDPDPIRGGKIVIQAKRYTNVVGVAAVRDLYGTVMNEGATKGILVTTSDYGSDSYNFAKDKPLTLLNGSNLLHLLEKHGHKAKIDIKEAKKVLKEQAA